MHIWRPFIFNLFAGLSKSFLGWPSQAPMLSKYKLKDLCNSTMFSFQEAVNLNRMNWAKYFIWQNFLQDSTEAKLCPKQRSLLGTEGGKRTSTHKHLDYIASKDSLSLKTQIEVNKGETQHFGPE